MLQYRKIFKVLKIFAKDKGVTRAGCKVTRQGNGKGVLRASERVKRSSYGADKGSTRAR